jgi:PAS domain S-box-containing protein
MSSDPGSARRKADAPNPPRRGTRERGERSAGGDSRGESELHEVLDAVPAHLWSAWPDGSVDYVNRRWQEFTGLPRSDALGWSWEATVHPDDRARFGSEWREALRNARATESEVRVRRADGEYRWLLVRNVPVRDAAGTLCRWYGIGVDVTELRQAQSELRVSEARFRTLVDFAADAFMLHAADGTVIDANHEACESLGYARDELVGMKPPQFDAALDPPALLEISRRIEAGEIVTFETRRRRKDGTTFPVEVRGRRVPDGDGWLGISFSRDITLRKHAEEERERLRRLEADLARINRVITMGELTASLAHEINQPIAAAVTDAKTCLRWLARAEPDLQEARDAAARIVKDVTRAASIIDRVRQLFRNNPPVYEPLDLSELLREIVALVSGEASLSGVTIKAELDGRLPAVLGDRAQLQQMLLNLVLNGIESVRGVTGPREVTVVARADTTDHVLVSVEDTGTGLPDVDPAELFEAFFTTKRDRTGMGLTISRSIVEAHSGQICATANAKGGASFTVKLPALAPGPIKRLDAP